MNRDYVIVRYLEHCEVEQTHIKGIRKALLQFMKEIEKDIKVDVELYMLKEGWTDLDADNVEEFPILTYDYEEEDFFLGEYCCIIFPIQNLEEAKNFKVNLKIYKFTSDKETFFFDENWMDYCEEPVLEIE